MRIGVYTTNPEERCCDGDEGRYVRRLFGSLRGVQDDIEFVILTHPANHAAYAGWECVALDGRGGGLAGLLGQDRALEKAIRSAGIDALFSPLASAPASVSTPQVLFALHLNEWLHPGGAGRARTQSRQIKRAASKARALVAPSEFVRRKLLEVFDIPLDKVVVAPPGAGAVFEQPQEAVTEPPFYLMAGQTCDDGLVAMIREAYDQVVKEHPGTLVVVGDACEGEPGDWGPNTVRIESCADPHLGGLYQHCACFFALGSCAGTGMQVLEAMRAGAPIVAPNIGAIEEFGGDTPTYYNPESTASLLRATRRVLSEAPEDWERRKRQGRQAAKDFSWEKSAWKVLNAFKRA